VPQPARPGIRAGQALGLTVFLATGVLLALLFVSRVAAGLGNLQAVAAAVSTLCAAIAAFAMLVDAVDLWVRGRRMTPYSVKMFRSLVFVAVLVALGASLLGGNSLVVPIMAPSMVVYLLIARRPPAPATAARGANSTTGGDGSTAKSRQRRGGKKRR
jgi:hypothetical protein